MPRGVIEIDGGKSAETSNKESSFAEASEDEQNPAYSFVLGYNI